MKKLIVFFFICIFFPGCLGALKATTQYAVPAIMVAEGAYGAVQILDDREEYYLGRSVAVNILKKYKLLTDPALTEYVDLVGQTVAMNSENSGTYGGYHFAILDSDEVNAFACPGGIIFITKGLIRMLGSEDELAAVLAHEVAHVNAKDGMSSVETSRWTQLTAIVGSATSRAYGSPGLNQIVGVFENSVSDIVKTLVVNGYTKKQEYAADEAAAIILKASGYDPGAVLSVISTYAKREKSDHQGMFRTHPGAGERVKSLEDKVKDGGSSPSFIEIRTKRFDHALGRKPDHGKAP